MRAAGAVPSAETLSQPLATQQGETPRKDILLAFFCPHRWYEFFPLIMSKLRPEGERAH